MRVNVSDLCAVRIAGMNLSTRMRIVWRRGKANVSRLLGNPPPEIHTAHRTARHLPYEVVEMIIAHIAHDLDALKACSLTCHFWHIATVSHLRYTLTLKNRGQLKSLSRLFRLGLMPLMKEIRVEQHHRTWLRPQTFSRRNLLYFAAFSNVQTLMFERLEISRFIPGVERYFAHFSATLRSITLLESLCTPQQLSHFLSLFPNLDDIAIWEFSKRAPNVTIPDADLVPFSTPRLRGRLLLRGSDSVGTWTRLTASGGGLQFHYMDLWSVGRCAPVLFEACANTLETLRFYAIDPLFGGCSNMGYPRTRADGEIGVDSISSPEFDLSQLKALRSLEVGNLRPTRHAFVMEVFSTITSPVFSELVIVIGAGSVSDSRPAVELFEALRTMSQIRPFKLVFLIVDPDVFQEESRREWERDLYSMAARRLLDFLDSPPIIRTVRSTNDSGTRPLIR